MDGPIVRAAGSLAAVIALAAGLVGCSNDGEPNLNQACGEVMNMHDAWNDSDSVSWQTHYESALDYAKKATEADPESEPAQKLHLDLAPPRLDQEYKMDVAIEICEDNNLPQD